MSLQLGEIAPDFTTQTTTGDLSLHHYLGDGWGLLFHTRKISPQSAQLSLGPSPSFYPDSRSVTVKSSPSALIL